MIDIDTERLQSLMNTLSAANDRIDEAASLLMQITTHDNWGCRERYAINEYTLKNRRKIQQLQVDSHNFLTAAKAAANEFTDTEKSISEMFSTLEGLISRIVANPVSDVMTNFSVGTVGTIASGLSTQETMPDSDTGMVPSAFTRIAKALCESMKSVVTTPSSIGIFSLLQSISVVNLSDLNL